MAGQLSSPRRTAEQLRSSLGGKSAGLPAASAGCATPRTLVKLLHHVCTSLHKHVAVLEPEVAKALQELQAAVKEAAHTHSAAATGKLHYYLLEGAQLAGLQSAAAALQASLGGTAKLSTYAAPQLQADVLDAVGRLSNADCSLPSSQLQLIDAFSSLAQCLDPLQPEIPQDIQQAADQLVRQLIAEVHGAFFSEEILDRELTHLERAAQHLDPASQRGEAALVKLLAAALMQLGGDESGGSDDGGLAAQLSTTNDPFMISAIPQVLHHEQLQESEQTHLAALGSPKLLGIGVAGADDDSGHTSSSPQRAREQQEQEQEWDDEEEPSSRSEAAQQHLDDFIESRTGGSCKNQDSRKAASFQAAIRLPPDRLERLLEFVQSTGRLRSLSLAHHKIGADGVQRLCQALMVQQSVRCLELPDNRLGDAGAAVLAGLLRGGVRLVQLQLSGNDIGDDGAIALAQAVVDAGTLEKLSLCRNRIGSAGCQALTAAVKANSSLKCVEFLPGNADAGLKEVQALARAVKHNRKSKILNLFGKHSPQ